MKYVLPALVASLLLISCKDDPKEIGDPVPEVVAVSETIDGFEVLAKGFVIPWAIEVINENEYLVSERLGGVYYYNNGTITELANAPSVQTVADRYLTYGGLMDISLHPQFETNRLVYITYVGLDYNMRVARCKLEGNAMQNLSVVFKTDAFSIGSRITWQDDDHFFVSQGSGGNPYPEPGGQDLGSDVGKIHRITAAGLIPADNPILEGFNQPTSIWSYGHRDPQGLYYDTDNNTLYQNEHGPLGGDELNVILKGENYGWPIFSHGLNYDETPVSDMTEEEAAAISQLPIKVWTPSIAPSSLVKIRSSNFDGLNGSLLMGALSQESIVRYNPDSSQSAVMWRDIGRVRDIAELPSGDLLVIIDRNSPNEGDSGRLIKLTN